MKVALFRRFALPLRNPSRTFFGWFKKPTESPPDPLREISVRDIAKSSLEKLKTSKKNLANMKSERPVFLIEPEEFFFYTYVPLTLEGYANMFRTKFDFEISTFDSEFPTATIYVNPQLDFILTSLKELGNVAIYTTATEESTEKILEKIGSEKFDFIENRFYQPDCIDLTIEDMCIEDLVKTLDHFEVDRTRTVIVDAKPMSFLLEPDNSYPIVGFNPDEDFDSKSFFEDAKALAETKDVREFLKARFQIRKTLKDIDILTK